MHMTHDYEKYNELEGSRHRSCFVDAGNFADADSQSSLDLIKEFRTSDIYYYFGTKSFRYVFA
jgi:hypothetical protein